MRTVTFPLFRRALPALGLLVASTVSWAQQQPQLASISEREIVRRQSDVALAQKFIQKGDQSMQEKDFEKAYVNYLDAVERIPAGPATAAQRTAALSKFSDAGMAYANSLIQNGRYSDAEKVAKTILLPQFNPGFKPAVQLLSNLEQPDVYNKTVTPQFAADRDEVTKFLVEADGFYATGRYDLALKRYEQVLNIDPYNSAARMGMERVNNQKSTYYGQAYNETRSRMLWLVDRAWERPVRRFDNRQASGGSQGRELGSTNTEAITAKLNRIIIPRITFNDVTVREAVEYLKQQSRALDTTTTDPSQKKGVNIVLKLPASAPETAPAVAAPTDPNAAAAPAAPVVTADSKITLTLTNVPLIEALRYLTDLAGLKYKVEPFAVSIVPITENTDELVTKEYRVPPGFIPTDTAGADQAGPTAGKTPLGTAEQRVKGRTDARKFLEGQGVPFPTGSFAQYVPAGSKLIVKNTQNAIDLIDTLVDAANGVQPTQVEIESKFLEISQNNLDELGFNWLIGPVSIGGGVYGSGGTPGYNQTVNAATNPFGTIGQNPLTGGLRSGIGTTPDSAITANSIDALLAGVAPGVVSTTPSVFGLAGVFSNPQFQVLIRALSQKKGIDLMSAPKVTTKSGSSATIKVVRQMPYPTEYSPPQIPAPGAQATGTTVITIPTGTVVSQGVVTPTTPTQFTTADLGVSLKVDPVVGPDNYTIDLGLTPEVKEFEGFINYGSPILGAVYRTTPVPAVYQTTLTQNVINQPVFSTRRVTTNVSIWDGQTVALGGLINENVQKTQDKVPILGDVPLAGRLFRSNVDQKIKKNLIIFVTARLMDAEGRPVRQDMEQEESVEPLGLPDNLPPPAFQQQKSLGK